MPSKSPLLALPQELRDLIFTHAIHAPLPWPDEFKEWQQNDTTATTTTTAEELPPDSSFPLRDNNTNNNSTTISYIPARCPVPMWYTLLFTCRQIHHDVLQLINATTSSSSTNTPATATAEITLSLTPTTATTTWLTLPTHPSHLSTIHITITIQDNRDRALTSGAPQTDNKIIRALTTFLQQFCTRGPNLSRTSPLGKPLQLRTVLLTLEPGCDLSSSSAAGYFFGGDPTQGFATVAGVLMIWLKRLVRSGLLRGRVGKIVWDCEFVTEMGAEPWEFEVERDPPGGEVDREIFKALGYQFD